MEIFTKLRKKGHRITSQRKEILTAVTSQPLTVQEIHTSLLRKKRSIDLASVYRTLELFSNQGFIHVVEFGDGKKRYELAHQDEHHHHAVCDNCGTIEDVFIKQEHKIMEEVQIASTFKIDKHSLEFFGLCASCQ